MSVVEYVQRMVVTARALERLRGLGSSLRHVGDDLREIGELVPEAEPELRAVEASFVAAIDSMERAVVVIDELIMNVARRRLDEADAAE